MVKTQVQIPDALYRRAKAIAADREWSFAEVVRRGLEHMAATHPTGDGARPWTLPPARRCGPFLAGSADWTGIAHED